MPTVDCARWNGPLARYVKLRVAHAPGMPEMFSPAADFKRNRKLAIPACITSRASRTCRDACRDRLPAVAGKTFPAFPAHAQLAILRIWQEAHVCLSNLQRAASQGHMARKPSQHRCKHSEHRSPTTWGDNITNITTKFQITFKA